MTNSASSSASPTGSGDGAEPRSVPSIHRKTRNGNGYVGSGSPIATGSCTAAGRCGARGAIHRHSRWICWTARSSRGARMPKSSPRRKMALSVPVVSRRRRGRSAQWGNRVSTRWRMMRSSRSTSSAWSRGGDTPPLQSVPGPGSIEFQHGEPGGASGVGIARRPGVPDGDEATVVERRDREPAAAVGAGHVIEERCR